MIDIDRLRSCLDDAHEAEPWLRSLCVANLPAAHANFTRMATHGVTLDLLSQISEQFAAAAPTLADPGHGDQQPGAVHRRRRATRCPRPRCSSAIHDALPNLLQIFSTSQYLSDLLVSDKEAYDLLRMTEGQPVARDALVEELVNEVRALGNYAEVLASLRRFKRRETLRIAYGDIVRNQPVETVDAADFLPGRCDRRSRARFRPAASGRAVRPAAARRRRAQPVRRARARQAGRHRAELFQRHRPHLPVRAGWPDRRPPHREQSGVFRAAVEGSDPPAHRADRLGHGVSRRFAAAAGRFATARCR